MTRHVAFIPARLGSKGLPLKNRLFFHNTADFIASLGWIDDVILSTDDPVLIKEGQRRDYTVLKRPQYLAGDAVPIKAVVDAAVKQLKLESTVVLWLFYIPILYKDKADFGEAKRIIDVQHVDSICTFIPAKTHPFNCWKQSVKTGELSQFIENDVYRRQDLPQAWMLHHYLCCWRVSSISQMNNELVCKTTHPIFLSEEVAAKLIEVDTPEDLARWQAQNIES